MLLVGRRREEWGEEGGFEFDLRKTEDGKGGAA
jgi:hypothetical protein